MTLKTLKDICYNLYKDGEENPAYDTPIDGVVRESVLKEEAIKWVKEELKQDNLHTAWILEKFFNITEEDLI